MNQDATHWEHRLKYAALSDVGLRREKNQDSLHVDIAADEQFWQRKGDLFIVADGMGAHAAGEVASKLAVERISETYLKLHDCSPPEAMAGAVRDANARIFIQGQAKRERRGMGTTVSALALLPQGALVGHVGDSRVYRFRGDRLEQLTFDHSVVWEICAAEGIAISDIPSYIPRNVITRSVGPEAEVQVDLEGPFPVEPGDTFLLCSDGLTGPVDDEHVGAVLGCLPPKEAVRALIDLANYWDGPDNITAIVIQAGGTSEKSSKSAPRTAAESARRIRDIFWSLAGGLGLITLVLMKLGHHTIGLIGLVGVLISATAGLVWPSTDSVPPDETGEPMLGKGPHMAFDCQPNAEMVKSFAEIAAQLRLEAVNRNWHGDWVPFNDHDERAAAATEKEDHRTAVAEHCRAICFMMEQLANRDQTTPPDEQA
jgi:serine/threonine protein phosphatase PrpC